MTAAGGTKTAVTAREETAAAVGTAATAAGGGLRLRWRLRLQWRGLLRFSEKGL